MKKWEINEEIIFYEIAKTYQTDSIKFIRKGGLNSTEPDVRVMQNDRNIFNIEIKSETSQAGQFVVLDYDTKFVFSERNKTNNNKYSQIIIDFMNENYVFFANPTSKSIPIFLENDVLEQWIINYYRDFKNSPFLATIFKNKLFIIPIEAVADFFHISAVYRVKKSGSSIPATKSINKLQNELNFIFGDGRIQLENGKCYYVNNNATIDVKTKIQLGDIFIYVANSPTPGSYEIRILSNTKNANIIFSIDFKGDSILPDNSFFESYIRNI